MNNLQTKIHWPATQWHTASPEEVDLNPTYLDQLDAFAESGEAIHSIAIVRNGKLCFERYYQGYHERRYHNINSCTKSVINTLVGIALHKGFLPDLQQPLLQYFPEYQPANLDPRKQKITLIHLMTMTSGYDTSTKSGEDNEIEEFLDRTASIELMLDRVMVDAPGKSYRYDDLSMHLLGLILQYVTDTSLAEIADTHLFEPLGIWRDEAGQPYPWTKDASLIDERHPFGIWDESSTALWVQDQNGTPSGAFGLQLTTHEMAKFGFLYLQGGCWDDQQLLPSGFAQDALRPHIELSHSGYSNWVLAPGGEGAFALGHGGQIIAVMPKRDMVVVITASPYTSYDIGKVFEEFLMPAITNMQRKTT
ncbi:MAG: serine hydrolase [Chloroflexota bacterium]